MSLNEAVLMCAGGDGQGCGYIGLASTFGGNDGDFVPCPACHQDWTLQLTRENFSQLVSTKRSDYAAVKEMLERYYKAPDELPPAKDLVSTVCVVRRGLSTFGQVMTQYLHRTPGKKRAVRVSVSSGVLSKAYLQPQEVIDLGAEMAHQKGWKNIILCLDLMYQESVVAYNFDLYRNQRYEKGHMGFFICSASLR